MDIPTAWLDLLSFYAVVLLLMFILVRLASGLLHRTRAPALGLAHVLVAALSIVVGAQIFATGGTPRYDLAAIVCLPPIIMWFVLDCVIVVRMRTLNREQEERDDLE